MFKAPSVSIRSEGSSGYVVVLYGIDGRPVDLRSFEFPPDPTGFDRSAVSNAARAYRDGVAEGIFRASFFLNALIGAGS